jgi:capsid protein
LQDINELLGQEIRNAKIAGEVIRMIIRDSGQADDDDILAAGGAVAANPASPDDKSALAESGGITLFGKPGEEVKQIESNRPSPNLLASLDWLTRSSLSGSGIPAEFLFDPARAGGAATRMIVQRAARRFATRGLCLDQRFMTPVWGFVIGSAIKSGALRPVKNWNRVAWISPKSLTVDFARDTNANLKELATGTKLLSDYLAETGGNLDRHLDKRGEIAAKITKAAAKWGVPEWKIYNPLQTSVSAGGDIAAGIISGEAVAPDDPATPKEPDPVTNIADDDPETIAPESPTDEPL